MSKSRRGSFEVSANSSGGWIVRDTRTKIGKSVHATREDAIDAARLGTAAAGGEIHIRDENGKTSTEYTLGRQAAANLNRIEGLSQAKQSKERERRFDRDNLSAEERIKQIVRAHQK